MLFEQITVVGVGLIGGSVGLAVRARKLAARVVGVDRESVRLAKAIALGAIDAGTTSIAEGVAGSHLVVVCTPVDRIAEVIISAVPHALATALFTDTGSVKRMLFESVRPYLRDGMAYIPAHPLAGAEKNGVEHARADLFENRVTVIAPETAASDAVELVERFWAALGSRTHQMNAAEHDRILATTSHLPHAIASAVAGITRLDHLALTAGGFRDVTRIAAGNPHLWAAIFQANRDAVQAALGAFSERMDEFKSLLEAGDGPGLVRWLSEGKQVRDALGS